MEGNNWDGNANSSAHNFSNWNDTSYSSFHNEGGHDDHHDWNDNFSNNPLEAVLHSETFKISSSAVYLLLATYGAYKAYNISAIDPKLPSLIRLVSYLCMIASVFHLLSSIIGQFEVYGYILQMIARYAVNTAALVAAFTTWMFARLGTNKSINCSLNNYSNQTILILCSIGPLLRTLEWFILLFIYGPVKDEVPPNGTLIDDCLTVMDITLNLGYVFLYIYLLYFGIRFCIITRRNSPLLPSSSPTTSSARANTRAAAALIASTSSSTLDTPTHTPILPLTTTRSDQVITPKMVSFYIMTVTMVSYMYFLLNFVIAGSIANLVTDLLQTFIPGFHFQNHIFLIYNSFFLPFHYAMGLYMCLALGWSRKKGKAADKKYRDGLINAAAVEMDTFGKKGNGGESKIIVIGGEGEGGELPRVEIGAVSLSSVLLTPIVSPLFENLEMEEGEGGEEDISFVGSGGLSFSEVVSMNPTSPTRSQQSIETPWAFTSWRGVTESIFPTHHNADDNSFF